jgi:hypothetical protein
LLRARELERLLGRKTLEGEILKEALELGERRLDCRGLQPGMAASSCSAFQFQGSNRASSVALICKRRLSGALRRKRGKNPGTKVQHRPNSLCEDQDFCGFRSLRHP